MRKATPSLAQPRRVEWWRVARASRSICCHAGPLPGHAGYGRLNQPAPRLGFSLVTSQGTRGAVWWGAAARRRGGWTEAFLAAGGGGSAWRYGPRSGSMKGGVRRCGRRRTQAQWLNPAGARNRAISRPRLNDWKDTKLMLHSSVFAGLMCVHLAAWNGHAAALKYLVKSGADINARVSSPPYTEKGQGSAGRGREPQGAR